MNRARTRVAFLCVCLSKVHVTCTFCGAGGGPSSLTLAPLPVYLFPAHFSKGLWTESELLDAECVTFVLQNTHSLALLLVYIPLKQYHILLSTRYIIRRVVFHTELW